MPSRASSSVMSSLSPWPRESASGWLPMLSAAKPASATARADQASQTLGRTSVEPVWWRSRSGGGAGGDVHVVEAATVGGHGHRRAGSGVPSGVDDPRLGRDRRRPGRTRGVVLPAPARDGPRRARRQPAPGRRLAAPLGVAGHGRRPRRRRPARVRPRPSARRCRPTSSCPTTSTTTSARHDLPVVRPVRVDRVESEGDLLVVRAGERAWRTRTLINATRHVDAPVRALLPRHRRRSRGSRCTPRTTRALSTSAVCGSWSSAVAPLPCSSSASSRR